VPLLAEQFKGVFDELYNQKDFVQKVVLEEETGFLRTLEKGLNLINEHIASVEVVKGIDVDPSSLIIQGGIAFELADTYGFPIDLTEL
ncbi:hypothetical protein H6A07_09810, partial [Olsenella uli]|uniref:alanine--tRNA ligase-related protein n=1 Tax=Olsenella uli TaxID=133926 RepID=UPI0019580855